MLLHRETEVFILTSWKIASCISSSGAAVTCLCGHVFGNPHFASGEFVQTSTVKSHRVEFDSLIVATRNGSEYWLGKPDPAESFAMQRLLRYLQESESVQTVGGDDDQTRMAKGRGRPIANIGTIPQYRPAANLTMFRRRATDREMPALTRADYVEPGGDRAAGAA